MFSTAGTFCWRIWETWLRLVCMYRNSCSKYTFGPGVVIFRCKLRVAPTASQWKWPIIATSITCRPQSVGWTCEIHWLSLKIIHAYQYTRDLFWRTSWSFTAAWSARMRCNAWVIFLQHATQAHTHIVIASGDTRWRCSHFCSCTNVIHCGAVVVVLSIVVVRVSTWFLVYTSIVAVGLVLCI